MKAGVPEEWIAKGLLTKIDLTRKLVSDALTAGLSFCCVCVGAFYGRNGNFRAFLRESDPSYCCDIASNTRVLESAARPAAEAGRELAGVTISALPKSMMDHKRTPATRTDMREGESGMLARGYGSPQKATGISLEVGEKEINKFAKAELNRF